MLQTLQVRNGAEHRQERQEGQARLKRRRQEGQQVEARRRRSGGGDDRDEATPKNEARRALSKLAAPSFGDASDLQPFGSQDLNHVPWRPSKGGRPCAEAESPTMTFADLGHLLIDLLDSMPTTSRKYLVQSTLPLKDPSPPFRRQRELLPLPMIIFVDRELPRKCSEARGSMSYGSARNAWTPLRLSAVSCEYHLATRSRAASITWRRWRSGRTAAPPTCALRDSRTRSILEDPAW